MQWWLRSSVGVCSCTCNGFPLIFCAEEAQEFYIEYEFKLKSDKYSDARKKDSRYMAKARARVKKFDRFDIYEVLSEMPKFRPQKRASRAGAGTDTTTDGEGMAKQPKLESRENLRLVC